MHVRIQHHWEGLLLHKLWPSLSTSSPSRSTLLICSAYVSLVRSSSRQDIVFRQLGLLFRSSFLLLFGRSTPSSNGLHRQTCFVAISRSVSPACRNLHACACGASLARRDAGSRDLPGSYMPIPLSYKLIEFIRRILVTRDESIPPSCPPSASIISKSSIRRLMTSFDLSIRAPAFLTCSRIAVTKLRTSPSSRDEFFDAVPQMRELRDLHRTHMLQSGILKAVSSARASPRRTGAMRCSRLHSRSA